MNPLTGHRCTFMVVDDPEAAVKIEPLTITDAEVSPKVSQSLLEEVTKASADELSKRVEKQISALIGKNYGVRITSA